MKSSTQSCTSEIHSLEAMLPLVGQFESSSKEFSDWLMSTKYHLEVLASSNDISSHLLADLKVVFIYLIIYL